MKMAVAVLDKLPVCTESGCSFTPSEELTAGSCTSHMDPVPNDMQ